MDPQGNLVETFDYDAFGNVRSAGGEALPEVSFGGDSRFQGMWKDAGTGLYYVRARYYDAQTGRFLSRDPVEGQLEQPESFMPYVFANGNPYVFRDPRGEFTLSELSISPVVSAAIIGAVSGAGFDVAFQLAFNGGNLRCVSLESAAISAGLGLLAGPLGSAHLTGVRRAYLATTQALARITNRVGRIAGRSAAKTVFDFLSGPVGAPLLLRNILTQGKILRDIVAAALRGRQALDKTLTRLAASAGSSNAGATAAASRAGAAQGGALVGLYDLPVRTCGR
jgi:RHS repeat-associated protein